MDQKIDRKDAILQRKVAQENQALDGVMSYLNLTRIGLKSASIVRNGRNQEDLSPTKEQIG